MVRSPNLTKRVSRDNLPGSLGRKGIIFIRHPIAGTPGNPKDDKLRLANEGALKLLPGGSVGIDVDGESFVKLSTGSKSYEPICDILPSIEERCSIFVIDSEPIAGPHGAGQGVRAVIGQAGRQQGGPGSGGGEASLRGGRCRRCE